MMPGEGGSAKFFGWLITAVVLHEVASNCMFVVRRFCSWSLEATLGGSPPRYPGAS